MNNKRVLYSLSDFKQNQTSLIVFNKIPQIEISRIFGPVCAELIHSGTQTDRGYGGENSPFARLWENVPGRRRYVKHILD